MQQVLHIRMHAQGAFRKVAAEADACAKHITRQLQQRVMAQDGEAAECIDMVRKLGAPVDSLQVPECVLSGLSLC